MKITKQELVGFNACLPGLKRFIKQTNGTDEAVEVSSLIGGENTYGDLLWLAGKTLPKEKIVRFACDCALINVELIKPYTDRFDEIVAFLKTPAAAAADAAADAAYYAADAAAAAAAYAAAAAAYAAAAAADAADAYDAAAAYAVDAANAAAAAASRDEMNELLRELFK